MKINIIPRTLLLFLAFSFLMALTSCKKEDETSQWERCTNCSLEQISGKYSGKATLYEYNMLSELTGQTYSEEAYLELNPQGNGIRIKLGVINLYSATIVAAWEEGDYTITSFSDGEFFGNIWISDKQIRITGINKRKSSGEVDLLRSLIDFEVIKTE